jgi:glycopeptide antibiotics resistance protein
MEFPNEVEDHVKKMCRIKTCMDMILHIATCHFIIYICVCVCVCVCEFLFNYINTYITFLWFSLLHLHGV